MFHNADRTRHKSITNMKRNVPFSETSLDMAAVCNYYPAAKLRVLFIPRDWISGDSSPFRHHHGNHRGCGMLGRHRREVNRSTEIEGIRLA